MKLKMIVLLMLGLLSTVLFSAAPVSACDICGTTYEYDFTGGQTNDVGSVRVWNSNDTLYVQFAPSSPWWLAQTHVHVGTSLASIPRNSEGIPVPGQFAYQIIHQPPVRSYTYVIPMTFSAGTNIVIAAHADVVRLDSNGATVGETAWGGDNPGPGNRWWFYIIYTITPCASSNGGCTPGYWRQENHFDSWSGYRLTDVYSDVFGVGTPITLVNALTNPNAFYRHSTAALLNAANPRLNYRYSLEEVMAMTRSAFSSGYFGWTASLFQIANSIGCPLG
jgi:hypothetical protein